MATAMPWASIRCAPARRVQPRHEIIQADLAHRHQARVVAMPLQRLGQARQVVVAGAVDAQRMDAQGIRRAQGVRDFTDRVEVFHRHRRQHQP